MKRTKGMKGQFISASSDPSYVEQRNLRRGGRSAIRQLANMQPEREQKPETETETEKISNLFEPSKIPSEIKYVILPPTIFYIGVLSEEFIDYGISLGFTLRKYENIDLSTLIHAKALILIDPDMEFGHYIETTNFASCYGIPIIWLSKKSIPHRYMWRFKLCLVGDISKEVFWSELWQLF